MTDTTVSIGQVKRDISELVNRVAFGGERIVLTSRGRPKAALVSVEDYEQLRTRDEVTEDLQHWQQWLLRARQLSEKILQRSDGQPIDVEQIELAAKEELEERGDELFIH
jgi:prevent-host-death family protein